MNTKLEPWNELGSNNNNNNNNKVVLITGASSGIGYEVCLDLGRAGYKIIAAARRVDRLKSLCQEINKNFGEKKAEPIQLDVSGSADNIEEAVNKGWEIFGTIDVLINNAGVRGTVKSPLKLSEEEWSSTLRTNLTGSWLVSKYVCLRMCAANKRGSVINISSTSGLNRGLIPGGVAYASSKAALNTLTKMMALELGPHGIRVNSICPGIFRSEITGSLLQKDWLKTVAEKSVPLRTHGTTDPALTSLIRYLIHESSQYVSGNIFIVEAGATLPGVPIFSSL